MSDPSDRKPDEEATPPLAGSLIRGSAWMMAMRWSIRLIGLVSTLILARLLDPRDFGLVAMAAIFVGLADSVFSLGVDLALIQDRKATREDFDTAWTIQLLQGLLIGTLLALAAPLVSRYFAEPRVEVILWILAASYVVQSAENIGTVAFRRDLEFARDYRYMVSKKVVSFAVTIGVAWWLRSYWALVAGMVAASVIGTLLSYWLSPYRPRLSLARWSKLWSFSQWILVRNLGAYAVARGDEFIVGGIAGARPMGLYSVAAEVSMLPSSELVAPLDRALFPGYTALQQHPKRLRAAYLKVLQLVALLTIPLGLGLSATASNVVAVMLGPKWTDMTPLVAILAVAGVVTSLRYTSSTILMALRAVKTVALLTWVNLVMFVALALPLAHYYGVTGVALAKLGLAVLPAPLVFGFVIARSEITWLDIGRALVRPAIGGAAMVAALAVLPNDVLGSPAASLACEVALGAFVYTAVVLLLWLASGRPGGAERLVLRFIFRGRGARP